VATNPVRPQVPEPNNSVIQWLLDSDPSIRWQVMRDLIGAPAEEVEAEPMLNGWHAGETRNNHPDMMRLTLEILARSNGIRNAGT
jgi:hypothetical protein